MSSKELTDCIRTFFFHHNSTIKWPAGFELLVLDQFASFPKEGSASLCQVLVQIDLVVRFIFGLVVICSGLSRHTTRFVSLVSFQAQLLLLGVHMLPGPVCRELHENMAWMRPTRLTNSIRWRRLMLSMEMGGLRFSFLFSIFITLAVVSSSWDSGTPDILKVFLRLYCPCSFNFSSIDFIRVFIETISLSFLFSISRKPDTSFLERFVQIREFGNFTLLISITVSKSVQIKFEFVCNHVRHLFCYAVIIQSKLESLNKISLFISHTCR